MRLEIKFKFKLNLFLFPFHYKVRLLHMVIFNTFFQFALYRIGIFFRKLKTDVGIKFKNSGYNIYSCLAIESK